MSSSATVDAHSFLSKAPIVEDAKITVAVRVRPTTEMVCDSYVSSCSTFTAHDANSYLVSCIFIAMMVSVKSSLFTCLLLHSCLLAYLHTYDHI